MKFDLKNPKKNGVDISTPFNFKAPALKFKI